MILTDKDIRNLCLEKKDESKPLIDPFDEHSLQSESYDLSISEKIATLKKEIFCINLDEQEVIDTMYENLDISKNGYIISPKEYILATLNENITLPDNITAHIRPRTKFTRLGLLISDQHCNSTYSGKLKIGIFNATDYPIKITKDLRIAQIVFEELKNIPSDYKQYKNKSDAAYQDENEFRGAKFPPSEFNKSVDRAVNAIINGEI